MARRVNVSTLNASTLDILNTIRANASYEYQSQVPTITQANEIPKVGDILYGYPALANQFLNALINRIALVNVKSAVFNNAYAELKKGYLEFGETVEEVFVGIAKAREFSAEKAGDREFKRTIPDVRSAFHCMNWRVEYPITVQQEDLRMAFTSINGVQDLIAKIVDAVYVAAEYDEFLLFKYLIIKAVAHGKMYPVGVDFDDLKNGAKKFRGFSNQLQFMSNKYNAAGVTTTTPKEDQYIFMDSMFNAAYDVDVLASAFNMDKATFSGKLKLIDDFATFDNERFDVIRAGSDTLEEVTAAELAIMSKVKAILIDKEWFQVYDNNNQFTEQFVASGLYWNYFYHTWKTVSSSPFSNAIVFVDDSADTSIPESVTVEVVDKSISGEATVLTLEPQDDGAGLDDRNFVFIQTGSCVTAGIAVHKYGAVIYPANAAAQKLEFRIGDVIYQASATIGTTAAVGDTFTFNRVDRLSALSITNVTLTPTFASGTFTYTGTTSNASGTLTATPADSTDTKVVTLNGTVVTGTSLSFQTGSNTLTIDVTSAREGRTSTTRYTATITRS